MLNTAFGNDSLPLRHGLMTGCKEPSREKGDLAMQDEVAQVRGPLVDDKEPAAREK